MKPRFERNIDELRIDVTDDALMVAEGLRAPNREPRDPSVWSKTLEEKAKLRVLRNTKYKFGRWPAPTKVISMSGKLIVYTNGVQTGYNKVLKRSIYKTTFSHECIMSDIPYLLSKYKTDRSAVLKYQWNGTTYSPDSLPFWHN